MAVQGACHCLLLTLVLLCFSPDANCSYRLWTRQASNEGFCNPTPVNFSNSFLSACRMVPTNDTEVCDRAWTVFSRAFAGKDPATVMDSDYADYFGVLPIVVERSASLFWSGTFELVEMVSCMCATGANVVSSANTPSSQIINEIGNVNWCGTNSNSSSDGIDYTNQCLCSVTTAFWAQFSTMFAQAASGSAFYLGYGEKKNGTFQTTSFFAIHELPNLSPPRVTDVVVIVVHRKGQGESCGEGTLVTLQRKIAEQNLKYSCYDVFGDPTDMSQVQDLSVCASRIITAVQQGTLPEENDCFSMMMGGSGTTLPHVFTLVSVLLFAVILPL